MCSVQQGSAPPVFVCLAYRPPDTHFLRDGANNMRNDFVDDLRTHSLDFGHKVIMGDLNANLLNDGSAARFVRQLASELSLKVVQHGATHHLERSHTWIDVMLADDGDELLGYENYAAPFKSNHNIINLILNIQTPEITSDTFTYRNFKNIDPADLNDFLMNCDWGPLQSSGLDLQAGLDVLNSNLLNAINALAPQKTFCPSKGKYPWIDYELGQLYKKRDAVYRRFKGIGDERFLQEFLRLREEAEARTEQAQTEFLQNRLSHVSNSNNMWRELRNLGLLPKLKKGLHGFSLGELNSHFARVSISKDEEPAQHNNIISAANSDGFNFKEVSLPDVILAISHFTSQAVGEDGIPQSVVVKALPTIGGFLVRLINSSLREGIFPDIWKKAHLLPLKKINTPSSVSDFRPIAILCFMSKVFEKVVHTQLMDYLVQGNILDPLQTGFRKHHSTQTALLKLTDDVRAGLDKKLITILLLFDFSKAFDTISPRRLLEQMRVMGFSRVVLQWVSSYLTGREQMVTSSSSGNSPWLATNLGVPQGSVLGPLLFCLYINDLKNFLPEHISHILYADDLQTYVQVPKDSLHDGLALIAEVARAVKEWARSSGLSLNLGKTKAIIFGSPKFIRELPSLGLAGVDLGEGLLVPFSDTVTSLGVVLDSRLSWEPQIDAISKKFNRIMFSLRFFRQYTTEKMREKLASTLAVPHLDYCSVVCLDATRELRERMQRLQNSCVRYIYGIRRSEHITPFRTRLGWLRTDSRRNYFMAVLMYKILRMHVPSYLAETFSAYQPTGPERRDKKELAIPRMRTDYGLHSFRATGAHFWNSLPPSIRFQPTLGRFKNSLWQHLLDLD